MQTERAMTRSGFRNLLHKLAAADYADIQQLANVGKTAEDYQQTALQSDY
jgi:hypothetical protein